ncbi:unnamed protein product [Mytilus coruscus]|uniref:Uncharacterized protein n=1 Tax=Mytilus coruscus TaxID=42192 RepID=A0A6J8F150_MYTCO|nr:unnamed protein product [Mytilus coruscus]
MCLHWTLRSNSITFNCKIDDLHLPVYIHNNFGKEIARCGIPIPFPLCTATYSNTTVRQNIDTNETVVGVKGIIDDSLNGNWSCHHGYGSMYNAVVEINIPVLQDLSCLKEVSFYTLTGVVISLVMIGIFCLLVKGKCKLTKGAATQYNTNNDDRENNAHDEDAIDLNEEEENHSGNFCINSLYLNVFKSV